MGWSLELQVLQDWVHISARLENVPSEFMCGFLLLDSGQLWKCTENLGKAVEGLAAYNKLSTPIKLYFLRDFRTVAKSSY